MKKQSSESNNIKEESMGTVIVLSGKAKQVFNYLALLAQYKGKKTLKELR